MVMPEKCIHVEVTLDAQERNYALGQIGDLSVEQPGWSGEGLQEASGMELRSALVESQDGQACHRSHRRRRKQG